MGFNADTGEWEDDEEEIDYSTRPDLAPPGSTWNPDTGGWDSDPSSTPITDILEDWSTPSPAPGEPPPPAPPPPPPAPGGGGGGGGGGDTGGTGGGGSLMPGSLLEGWGRVYQPRPGLGQWTLPDLPEYKAPPRPELGEFAPTTGADVLADPSYAFRLEQGWKPIQANKAFTGMLRSGPTLKALTEYGQSFGSQEFGNVDHRRRADFTTNRDTKLAGYDRDFDASRAEFEPKLLGYSTEAASRQRQAEQEAERSWREYLQEWVAWDRDRNFKFDSLANMRDYDLRAATS